MAWAESLADLMREFWWFFAILVGSILTWIYVKKFSPSTKAKLKEVFTKKRLFLMAYFGIWYLWYKSGGNTTIQNSTWWMPILGLIFLAGNNFIGQLRYETQQIVCANGFHGSYSEPPLNVNGFIIFAIDTFNCYGLSWNFAKRILILREETVALCDRGAVSIARPDYIYDYELDPDVRNFISNDKFFKGRGKKIYYGWFNSLDRIDYKFEQLSKLEKSKKTEEGEVYELLKKEFGIKNPKISKLYWLYRNECKASNKQTEQYDATVIGIEKQAEHTRRIKTAYDVPEKEQFKPPQGEEGY